MVKRCADDERFVLLQKSKTTWSVFKCPCPNLITKLIIENNLFQNKTKIGMNKNKPNIKRTIRLAAEKANVAIRNHSNF